MLPVDRYMAVCPKFKFGLKWERQESTRDGYGLEEIVNWVSCCTAMGFIDTIQW
jgi:hypothetical protein